VTVSLRSTRLLLLGSVVIWGWTFVATKILLAHVTPFELVGLRFAIGLPILFTILRLKGIALGFDPAEWRPLSAGAAIIAVHFLVQAFALSRPATTATNTGWIISFSPLGMALLSRMFLDERLRARQIQGVVLATLGVLLLVSKGHLESLSWLRSTGDWMIFGTAFTWALYTIVTRDLSRRRSPLAVTFVVFLPLCVSGLVAIAIRGHIGRFLRLPARAVIALLFLGVLGTLAQWFWQMGIARIGAARAGIYVYLEPLATTVLAVPVLRESFGLASAAGGALVLLGVWQAERGPVSESR
jgi:drug/metabolite transporter (DMT)-like permease